MVAAPVEFVTVLCQFLRRDDLWARRILGKKAADQGSTFALC
jgi:hypothetical protein